MGKKRIYLLNNTIFSLLIIGAAILVIFRQEDVKSQLKISIDCCLKVVIPSLYGVMLLSEIIVRSGIYRVISKPFAFLGNVFNIPSDYVSIFLISHIGGYPVGAKLINTLPHESAKLTNRLTNFCFASGPAFIGGVVASELYNNSKIGLLLFVSITISNIIFAIVSGFFSEKISLKKEKIEIKFDFQLLIDSAINVGAALLKVCAMVLACSVIIGVIRGLNSPVLFTFIDITNVVFWEKNNIENLPMIAALLSFGGFCVAAQVVSIIKIDFFRFIRARLICGGMSYFICKFLTPLFIEMPISEPKAFSNLTPIFSALILVITVSLISDYRQEHGVEKHK